MVNAAEPMRVQTWGVRVPVDTTTCGHGREMGYNLREGIAAHLDDGSVCRQTGLPHGVDEELASRDNVSTAVLAMLGDAFARLDGMLTADGLP